MPGDAVGPDGLPICDEFACQTWGCWCDRAPDPVCEHGNHPRDCPRCGPDLPAAEHRSADEATAGKTGET